MRRVVVDTNIIVSSIYGGKPRQLRDLWQDEEFVWCLSEEIYAEYEEVLGRFEEAGEEAKAFLAMLRTQENVLFVVPEQRLHVISSDPSDDKFLECALAAEADLIVSGDRHLLALGGFCGIPILDPAQALPLLEEGANPSPVE